MRAMKEIQPRFHEFTQMRKGGHLCYQRWFLGKGNTWTG